MFVPHVCSRFGALALLCEDLDVRVKPNRRQDAVGGKPTRNGVDGHENEAMVFNDSFDRCLPRLTTPLNHDQRPAGEIFGTEQGICHGSSGKKLAQGMEKGKLPRLFGVFGCQEVY